MCHPWPSPSPARWIHQVTLSPVFILLLEENSFRDRVTSLQRGGGQSCERGGDPHSGVGGSAKPSAPPRRCPSPRATHWDTSAMCLWRRVTHRSSSSSRRTSLIRASPMPLVSYLG